MDNYTSNRAATPATLEGALGVDLVGNNICLFLDLTDLKALSLASKCCRDAVRDSDKFYEDIIVKFPENTKDLGVAPFQSTKWKKLIIDTEQPLEFLSLIENVLQNVKYVYIKLYRPNGDYETQKEILTRIFEQTSALDSLSIDLFVLGCPLDTVFAKENILSNIRKIKQFNIRVSANSIGYFLESRNLQLTKNLLALENVLFKLVGFSFDEMHGFVPTRYIPQAFVQSVIKNSKDTLEDLHIWTGLVNLEELKTVAIPGLKRLHLNGILQTEIWSIETIIHGFPQLETLYVDLNRNLPKSLLQSLGEFKDELKELHISAPDNGDWFSRSSDYEFIKQMNRLKKFSISYSKSDGWFPSGLISLDAISPVGLQKLDMFRALQITGVEHALPNLTVLRLCPIGQKNADPLMQQIIIHCKNLKTLELRGYWPISEYGLSGFFRHQFVQKDLPAEKKPALKDLKGLTHLEFGLKEKINPKCMLHVMQFQFLKKLKHNGISMFGSSIVRKILKQNPCLEYLALPMIHKRGCGHENQKLLASLRRSFPRLLTFHGNC